jgi:hypothetical protein
MYWTPYPNNPDKSKQIYGKTYLADTMMQAQAEVDSLRWPYGDTTE